MLSARTLPLILATAVALPATVGATEPDTVIMNLDQFLELYETARDPAETPTPSPRDYTISSAAYAGRVITDDGEPTSALFEATLRIEVLKDTGWVQIPLLPGTVAVRSATVGGRQTSVVSDGSWLYLVTDRKGAFEVDLEFATSVFTSEGRSNLSFQPPGAGAVEVTLAVPADDALDFTVAAAKLQSDRVEGDTRIVEAVLPGTASVAVSWQREVPEDPVADEPRVYAEVFSLVGLGDGLLSEATTISYTILQAGIDQLSVRIPDGATLLDVRGAGIRDWTLAADGTLGVDLNYAAEGSYSLQLILEQAVGSGDLVVSAPLPTPLGVDRSKGWVGVEARGTLEIAAGEATGVTPVDVRLLPAAILGITSNPVLLGYKYLGTDASLPLEVTQHEDVAVLVTLLDRATATTMFTIDGRRLTSVSYRVRNNRKQFLRLALPEGAELWSASVAGKAVQPARASDGRILIPLVRSQSSGGSLADFEVGVVYVESGAAPGKDGRGSFRATMPQADVPITYVAWTVWAPHKAKVPRKGKDGSLRWVDGLSQPYDARQTAQVRTSSGAYDVQQGAQQQLGGGGLGEGAVPVEVTVPLEGKPLHFEKLLALGEELWVGFDYRGLK